MNIDDVVEQMTMEEKAALLSGADMWRTVAIERVGIPAIMCSDGPHGLRAQPDVGDHVGLGGSIPATCFPTASALASSWDVDLLHEAGQALGREARACGVAVLLGPGVNIKRSPLCGRNFEYFSEDPFLTGELGAAYVKGVQSTGVGTSLKHYAANNQEDDRLRVNAVVDERTLREIYLPAFERIVTTGDPWTVMCAYNRVNGPHASENHWLLTEVLRDEWGWNGVVVSDWGAVHDRVAAIAAGLDWEMPPDLARSPGSVVAAVHSGQLTEEIVDRSVRRMLALVEKAVANDIAVGAESGTGRFDEGEHHELARRAAAQSIVLLKNDDDLLPLDAGTVCVIGEFARTPRFQGAGSSQVNPTRVDDALGALIAALGDDRISFAAGYEPESTVADDALLEEAVGAAGRADTVIVFLGLPASYESEGFDRTHIELPSNQLALLDAVVAANPRLAVVLVNGSVVRMSDWQESVPAIVEAWLGGQAGGSAIADVLTGRVNPSGRLAETIPLRLEDNSATLNFPGDSGVVRYGEGIFVGYRAYDRLDQEVSFPFGFGLSYTMFDYGTPEVIVSGAVETHDLHVTVKVGVTNSGDVGGAEVVQMYVADPEAAVARPVRELKGFTKIHLEPGQSETVTMELDQRSLSYWSIQHKRWVVEAGHFVIEVGPHSRDLRQRVVLDIEAPSLKQLPDVYSTLQEWLEHDRASQLLREHAGDSPLFSDEEMAQLVGSFPMDSLATFPGIGFDHETLADLATRLAGETP